MQTYLRAALHEQQGGVEWGGLGGVSPAGKVSISSG